MPIMREGASSQDSVYALHKSLRAAEVSVLNTALGHPACDDQTRLDILNDSVQAQMRITDAETVRTTIIEHPATSDAVLDKAIVRDSTAQSSRLSPTGWEKVRRARLNRPGLAIYAAVHDDDDLIGETYVIEACRTALDRFHGVAFILQHARERGPHARLVRVRHANNLGSLDMEPPFTNPVAIIAASRMSNNANAVILCHQKTFLSVRGSRLHDQTIRSACCMISV